MVNLRTDSHRQFEIEKIGIGIFGNNSADFTQVCDASVFAKG